MQIYILCNNLGLLIYGLLFTSVCYAGRIFGKLFFCTNYFIHLLGYNKMISKTLCFVVVLLPDDLFIFV